MRVVVFSLSVTFVFGWYPCNPKHCKSVCEASMESYCDIPVTWTDTCKTAECGYVYEFQDLSGLNRPNPVISGTITSLDRQMELDTNFEMGSRAPQGADCWWYLIFPPNYRLIGLSITKQHVVSREKYNVMEFRMQGLLFANYTISIPCNQEKMKSALARKDAILFFIGDRNNSNAIEYTLNWTAALNNFSTISEIYDTSRPQTTTATSMYKTSSQAMLS